MEVNVHQAKTNLSKLILRAEAGEEVIIARAGKAVVRLVPVRAAGRKVYKAGALKGRLQVPSDFLSPDSAPDKELEESFYDSPVPTRAPRKAKPRKP
jgi:prevent-host-death family protein